MKRLALTFALTGAALGGWTLAWGDQGPPLLALDLTDATILAEVGADTISVGDFRQEMVRRSGGLPGQFATLEQRRALLEEMVRFRSLVARARADGYDHDPTVVSIFERAMVSRLQEDRRRKNAFGGDVTDQEVAAYYQEHQRDYDRPERIRGAIVFLKGNVNADEAGRDRLESRARTALEEARALDPNITHFGPVARRYSDDRASRYVGGVIGWMIKHPDRQYKWDPAVINGLFALKEPGEIGPIIRTDDGMYLIRLVALEPAQTRPIEEVQLGIRHQLIRNRQQTINDAFEKDVLDGVDVAIDEKVLAGIEAPNPATPNPGEPEPPKLPAG